MTANYSFDGLDRLTQLRYVKATDTVADNQYGYNEANHEAIWLGSGLQFCDSPPAL
jgi:hypothetical protein